MVLHNMCIDDDDLVPDEDAMEVEGLRVKNYRTAPNFDGRNLAAGGRICDEVAQNVFDQY